MTLGRCSIANNPFYKTLQLSGDHLSFSSAIKGVAVAEMQARIQQLRGLMDNADESVFPVMFSVDSSYDGFYTDFQVSLSDSETSLLNGFMPFTVSARRVTGAASALFENTASIVVLTNGFSLPTGLPIINTRVGVPYTDLFEVSIINKVAPTASTGLYNGWSGGSTRTTDDGLVRSPSTGAIGIAMINTPGTVRWSWATTPALFYEASCKFEQSYGGTYYPLHGQQILKSSNAWRVSNGLMRISLSATTIDVSHYDGAGWDTAKSWTLGSAGGDTGTVAMTAIKSVRVTKNTSQQVTVRVGFQTGSAATATRFLSISLRRGCRWAAFSVDTTALVETAQWYIDNNEAATAITGGLKATSTDASGNKYVVGSPIAQTNVTGTGRLKITTASALAWPFMIGSAVGADGSEVAALDEYICAMTDDQRVVAR